MSTTELDVSNSPSPSLPVPLREKSFLLLLAVSVCTWLAFSACTRLQFFIFPEKILFDDKICSCLLFTVGRAERIHPLGQDRGHRVGWVVDLLKGRCASFLTLVKPSEISHLWRGKDCVAHTWLLKDPPKRKGNCYFFRN